MKGEDFIGIAGAIGTAGMSALGIISGIYNIMVDEVGSLPAIVLGVMGAFVFATLVLAIYNTMQMNQLGVDDK